MVFIGLSGGLFDEQSINFELLYMVIRRAGLNPSRFESQMQSQAWPEIFFEGFLLLWRITLCEEQSERRRAEKASPGLEG